MAKIQNKKISDCCKTPIIGGVQCENCGSNGKFSTGTAIVKRLDIILDLLSFAKKYSETEAKPKLTPSNEQAAKRFIDCGDGTIKDTKTGLMWQKEGSQERLNYAGAENFVAELNKEQYPDWRISTREELESILDLTKHDPAIDPIFKCESAGYWSSTPYAGYTDYAWVVNFYYGLVYNINRILNYYVRPVRQYL